MLPTDALNVHDLVVPSTPGNILCACADVSDDYALAVAGVVVATRRDQGLLTRVKVVWFASHEAAASGQHSTPCTHPHATSIDVADIEHLP